MAVTNWENLAKNGMNPQTIPAFVDEKIGEHNANATAHLASEASLAAHRASVVCDHRAESVVNDKIQLSARRYKAIVDPTDEEAFDTIASAIIYAKENGGGAVFLTAGTHYVVEPLELPRGVDIEGEGVEETIIDFDSGDNSINPQAVYRIGGTFNKKGSTTIGSPIVTFDDPQDWEAQGVIVGAQIYTSGAAGINSIIESIDSSTQLTAVANATATSSSKNQVSYLSCNVNPATNVATFSTLCELENAGMKKGQQLIFEGGYPVNPVIKNFPSDYSITMSFTPDGIEDEFGVEVENISNPVQYIKGCTLQNSTADYFINDAGNEAIYNITDCLFTKGVRAFYQQIAYTKAGTIEGCTFSLMDGSELYSAANVTINNCEFDITETIDWVICGDENMTIDNCRVNVKPGINVGFLRDNLRMSAITNCTVYGVNGIYKTSGGTLYNGYGNRIQANRVTFKDGENPNFRGRNNIVIGNQLTTTASYAITIPSGYNKNTFIGNLINKTIINNATGSTIANNTVV